MNERPMEVGERVRLTPLDGFLCVDGRLLPSLARLPMVGAAFPPGAPERRSPLPAGEAERWRWIVGPLAQCVGFAEHAVLWDRWTCPDTGSDVGEGYEYRPIAFQPYVPGRNLEDACPQVVPPALHRWARGELTYAPHVSAILSWLESIYVETRKQGQEAHAEEIAYPLWNALTGGGGDQPHAPYDLPRAGDDYYHPLYLAWREVAPLARIDGEGSTLEYRYSRGGVAIVGNLPGRMDGGVLPEEMRWLYRPHRLRREEPPFRVGGK